MAIAAALLRCRPVLLTASAATLLLGACANGPGLRPGEDLAYVENDPVHQRIAEAAERASAALNTMSLIDQQRMPVDTAPDVLDAPAELLQPVTVSWTGPVESLVQLMAETAGYQFRVIGYPPSTPLIVTVNAVEERLVDVLRDTGLQVGQQAEIAVSAEGRVIEIRYGPVAGWNTPVVAEPVSRGIDKDRAVQ